MELRDKLEKLLFSKNKTTTNERINTIITIFEEALPGETHVTLDVDPDTEFDEEPMKFCTTCGNYEFEGVLNCKCSGYNKALTEVKDIITKAKGK